MRQPPKSRTPFISFGLALALIFASTRAAAEDQSTRLDDKIHLALKLVDEYGTELEPVRAQKLEGTLQPTLEVSLTERTKLTAIARFHFDALDRLEPGFPAQRE